jgi:protein involved in polysaccharide export with SLBB domain
MATAAHNEPALTGLSVPQRKGLAKLVAALLLLAVTALGQGCAALSNPVANGIPVHLVPPELLGESRENMLHLPLSVLKQPAPAAYKLGPGDVLGIWIEGVLGEKGQPPLARSPETFLSRALPTSLGYPIPIRASGTISLPMVPPIKVEGLTLEQAEEEIRKAYTVTKKILQPERGVIVTLQHPREFHVLVIRQDVAPAGAGGGPAAAGGGATGARSVGFLLSLGGGARGARQGTGYTLDLPAYENDVLNALARTGGVPGTSAVDEIIIERGGFQGEQGRQSLVTTLQGCPGSDPASLAAPGSQRFRIPLRYRPGHPPIIRPEDVILQSGDIILIEAREADVFFTGGLLPAGEYVLPRDIDLNVVEAIVRVGGPLVPGGINTANIQGQLIEPGLSLPYPTQLSVIRQTPCLKQIVIRVDLDRALREPRERILVQPKDVLLLQESPQDALGRYLYEVLFFPLRYTFSNSSRFFGGIGFNAGYTTGLTPPYP